MWFSSTDNPWVSFPLSNRGSPPSLILERKEGLSHCPHCVWHKAASKHHPFPVLCSTINHHSHPCCSPTEATRSTTLNLGHFLSLGPAERYMWSGLCFPSFPGVLFSRAVLQKALESVRLYQMVPREPFKPEEKYFKLHIKYLITCASKAIFYVQSVWECPPWSCLCVSLLEQFSLFSNLHYPSFTLLWGNSTHYP